MQYKPEIITKPLQWVNREEIVIGTKGDSFFVGFTPNLDQTLYTLDTPTIPSRHNGLVWLDLAYQDILSVVTEGDSFTITVTVNNAPATDLDVNLVIDYDKLNAPAYIKESEQSEDDSRVVDYSAIFYKDADLTSHDIGSDTFTITIPTGQKSASLVVNTVDDLTLIGGDGYYKIMNVSLDSVSDNYYTIATDHKYGSVLLEDASIFPKWQGDVYLWAKMHPLLDFEPLIDPDTDDVVTVSLGFDADDDSTVRSKIIDDTPLYSIQLRPNQSQYPEDVDALVDISSIVPLYRTIVQVGRRT